MWDNREFDEDKPDERLSSLEELISENGVDETEPFEDTLRILQEIEDELLSKSDCEELVKECVSETYDKTSVENTEQDEFPQKRDGDVSRLETKPDSIRFIEDLHLAFSKNPKMFFRESAVKEYNHASLYCKLMNQLDAEVMTQESSKLSKFASEHDIHRKTVTEWSKQKKKPRLIRDLEEHRRTMLTKPREYTLDVNEDSVCFYSPNENMIVEIYNKFQESETKLIVIDTSNLIRSQGQNYLEPLKERLQSNEEFTYRFGEGKDRLVIWKQDTNSVNLNRAYENQYYYFSEPSTPISIVRDAINRLGLDGNIAETDAEFKNLVQQLTSNIGIEYMKWNRIRVLGSTLNFLIDILGCSLRNFQGLVEKLAGKNGHGGIHNPIFLEGHDFETVLAGMLGVVVSDCHVRSEGSIGYFESNLKRIGLFYDFLSQLGEIKQDSQLEIENGTYTTWIPSVLSEIVRLSGIPSGDRTILNYGLPTEYHDWFPKAKQEYMKQMLAQESAIGSNGRVQWTRTNALHAGTKTRNYNFATELSTDALEFLKDPKRTKSLTKKEGYEKIRENYITMGRLKQYIESPDTKVSVVANEILGVIMNNRNRLLDDEVEIVRSFGIEVSVNPLRISYHENSELVTITWGADIQKRDSKIRCALAFPPNHPDKIRNSELFLSTQSKSELLEIIEELGKSMEF